LLFLGDAPKDRCGRGDPRVRAKECQNFIGRRSWRRLRSGEHQMATPAVPGLELLQHAKREQPVLVHEVNPKAQEQAVSLHTLRHRRPSLLLPMSRVVVIDANVSNARPLLVDQSLSYGLAGRMLGKEYDPLSL